MKLNILIFGALLLLLSWYPTKKSAAQNPSKYILSVLDFGAKADGRSDDSKSFQSAINEAKKTGARLLYVPPGRYFFDNTVKIDIEGLKIYSDGGLSYQRKPSWYITGTKGLKTLFSIIDSDDNNMSFEMEGINFYNKDVNSGSTSAIEVNTTYDKPSRPFTLSKCSFSGFAACIHFNSQTRNNQYTWGFVNIYDNVFYRNTYAVLATSGIIGFRFERNESEQGGRIKGSIWGNIWIVNNNFEGQPNPIDIKAPGTGYVYLAHNYYESNMSVDAINKFSFGGKDSYVKVDPNFNMFETKNFISVSGAKLKYEGDGDIGATYVYPSLQHTLSFFNKVAAGNAFTVPVINVSVGKYPVFAALLDDENVAKKNTGQKLGQTTAFKSNSQYELRYNKNELSTVLSFPNAKIKAGEIVKIILPYRYINANSKESFYLELRDIGGGKTNLSGGYLSDVNKLAKSRKCIFYAIVAPYDLDGIEVHIHPFASQSKDYANAQFNFESVQLDIHRGEEAIVPSIFR